MYLEIDEGYFEHPKTLDLCARLEDPKACVYPLRLWKWACRSAKSGKLGKITAFAIERAVDHDAMDGKCFAALLASGFLDTSGDGTFAIHDWMDFTGGAIARMDAKVKQNKDRREAARRQRDAGTMPELCRHDAGQTRQDQTRQDQTSPKREGSPPKVRPNTSRNLLTCIKIAVEAQPMAKMWGAEPLATKNADEFLQSLGDVEKALPDLEDRIALFAADPDMQPWTVRKFCEKYNGIGKPKMEFGRVPKVSEVPTQTPVLE